MIYVITEGSYSDYHIITATLDHKAAKRLAKQFNANIEKYEDGKCIPADPIWVCFIGDDGVRVSAAGGDYAVPDAMLKKVYYNSKMNKITTYVFAKDEAHATKIACDRYAEWKANQSIGDLYNKRYPE